MSTEVKGNKDNLNTYLIKRLQKSLHHVVLIT